MLNNFTLRYVTKSLRFGILEKVEPKALFHQSSLVRDE